MIEAVLFDLDGTLYDQSSYIVEGFKKVAGKISKDFKLGPGQQKNIYERLTDIFEHGDRNEIFNQVLKMLFPKKSSKFINNYVEKELLLYFKLVPRKLGLFRDVMPLFRFLKEKKKKMGLITQGHPINQMNKLFLLGIFDYFDVIEISGNYHSRKAKPSVYMFRKVLQKLDLEPEKALYIGDDLSTDIGAYKIGMRFYHLIRAKGEQQFTHPDVPVIHSLSEVKGII